MKGSGRVRFSCWFLWWVRRPRLRGMALLPRRPGCLMIPWLGVIFLLLRSIHRDSAWRVFRLVMSPLFRFLPCFWRDVCLGMVFPRASWGWYFRRGHGRLSRCERVMWGVGTSGVLGCVSLGLLVNPAGGDAGVGRSAMYVLGSVPKRCF